MSNYIIGIDNGVTGSLGILCPDGRYYFFKTPVDLKLNYQKTAKNLNRVNVIKLEEIFKSCGLENQLVKVFIERPMVNPGRFSATLSAVRCLEATLIVCEKFNFSVQYLDSKNWQTVLLPQGLKKEQLKKASCDIACRMFPLFKDAIMKQGDGDSLLIAEYARRSNL